MTEQQIEATAPGTLFLDQDDDVWSREAIMDAIDFWDSEIAGCVFRPCDYVGESDTVHLR